MSQRNGGTAQPGPSELYLKLLKGEITPEEYAKRVRRSVDRKLHGERKRAAAAQ
jgi:hypothetical protein